jgi:hypothetical protein
MEQAVFTDISPVKATNISANPQSPKIRVLTLTRQLRRSTMFIAHTTPMLVRSSGAPCALAVSFT